jgi:hypothetical protein
MDADRFSPPTSGFRKFYYDYFGENFSNGLMWPGAAGNVFWSFLFLTVDHESRDQVWNENTFASRTLLLVLLAGYLSVNWALDSPTKRTEDRAKHRHRIRYWLFDQLHILPLVARRPPAPANRSSSSAGR